MPVPSRDAAKPINLPRDGTTGYSANRRPTFGATRIFETLVSDLAAQKRSRVFLRRLSNRGCERTGSTRGSTLR